MCLAVPVIIQNIEAPRGRLTGRCQAHDQPHVDARRPVVGDYVLVHAGYAIGIVDEEEAKETLHLL